MKKDRTDLQQLNIDAAGIDIGSEFHFVAVPEDRAEISIRKFFCFTADLREMAQWLKECGIRTVAMESTGVYWMPVFQILEENGFEVLLVNARHIKNVPGRKTDIVDSRWIQQLHTYGLLTGSYQPESIIRRLRTYMRHKDTLIKSRSTHVQRMQKCLIQMNIQLHKVISDITGQTGMKIIRAILDGVRDSEQLAQMKNKHIKNSFEVIKKSLEGNYQDDLLFCLKQEVEQYDYIDIKINECEKMINGILDEMDTRRDSEIITANKPKDIKKNSNQYVALT
jgi:transposase